LAINVYIQLDSTKAFGPGPYNIYYRDSSNNLVFREGPLSTEDLIAGQNYSVPDDTQIISVKSINPACNGFIKDVVIQAFPSPTPTATPSPTVTPLLSPTVTPTLTPSITVTPSITPTFTPTPTLTPTITPTPSKPQVSVTVNLTIDSGNTGYTQIYNNNTGNLLFSMNTNGSTYTFSLTSGISYRVETIIQTRIFLSNVAQINNYINGIADAGSPYISNILNTPAIIIPTTVSAGNSYVVNTFVGAQRPV
jgi:hypothetical protein